MAYHPKPRKTAAPVDTPMGAFVKAVRNGRLDDAIQTAHLVALAKTGNSSNNSLVLPRFLEVFCEPIVDKNTNSNDNTSAESHPLWIATRSKSFDAWTDPRPNMVFRFCLACLVLRDAATTKPNVRKNTFEWLRSTGMQKHERLASEMERAVEAKRDVWPVPWADNVHAVNSVRWAYWKCSWEDKAEFCFYIRFVQATRHRYSREDLMEFARDCLEEKHPALLRLWDAATPKKKRKKKTNNRRRAATPVVENEEDTRLGDEDFLDIHYDCHGGRLSAILDDWADGHQSFEGSVGDNCVEANQSEAREPSHPDLNNGVFPLLAAAKPDEPQGDSSSWVALSEQGNDNDDEVLSLSSWFSSPSFSTEERDQQLRGQPLSYKEVLTTKDCEGPSCKPNI